MSAKNAQDSLGLIIHVDLTCGNFRTVERQDGAEEGPQTTTFAARFWAKVERKSAGECWPWLACTRGPAGYGAFKVAGKYRQASHVSWEMANGRALPSGLIVLHSCDNPRCVNPAHLTAGTQLQNVHDAIAKGRHVHPDYRLRKNVRNQYSAREAS